jgi:hypothetical protein
MTTAEKLLRAKQDLDDAYEAGVEVGKAQGGGGDSHYDTFWDNYQTNGNRTSYNYAFAGEGWNNITFKPKYPIVVVGASTNIFDTCALSDFDFVENGVVLDTSGATSLIYTFRECLGIKRIGTIDCKNCKDLNRTFYNCKTETIDKFIVHENLTYSNTFDYTNRLVNITIEGVIGKNGFKLTSSVLSKASITSIINALSTTTSGLTVTLSKTAINTAFGINVDDTSTWPEGSEYYTLRHSKDNWTFSYS